MFETSSNRVPGLLLELDEEWAAPALRNICEREPEHHPFLQILAELGTRSLPEEFLLDDLQNTKGLDVLGDAEETVWLADQCGYFLGFDYLYRIDPEEEGGQAARRQPACMRGANRMQERQHPVAVHDDYRAE